MASCSEPSAEDPEDRRLAVIAVCLEPSEGDLAPTFYTRVGQCAQMEIGPHIVQVALDESSEGLSLSVDHSRDGARVLSTRERVEFGVPIQFGEGTSVAYVQLFESAKEFREAMTQRRAQRRGGGPCACG